MSGNTNIMGTYNLFDHMIVEPFNHIVSFGSHLPEDISNYINEINQSTDETLTKILNSNNITELQEITMDLNITFYNNLIQLQINTYITLFLITLLIYSVNKLFNYYLQCIYEKDLYNKKKEYNKQINNIFHNINTSSNKITEGIFIDSLKEIEINNKYIIEKMKYNTTNNYYILLRIKTKNPIDIITSKYNLRNNKHTEGNKINSQTNDNYMLMKFNYDYEKFKNYDINIKDIIINNINFLNYLSNDAYKNKDFVVLAISNSQKHFNSSEFFNGLFNIKYENFNIKNVIVNNTGMFGFTLLLPTKKVYDMYMDVFNDVIFESTAYKINSENTEYWYTNDLKEIM
jgi:hypothetical protein